MKLFIIKIGDSMRSKRGFTLVELLAVIAILAILVIMALPAVLRMFNQARIDTFGNEINTILRTARQQYLLDGGNAHRLDDVIAKRDCLGIDLRCFCADVLHAELGELSLSALLRTFMPEHLLDIA